MNECANIKLVPTFHLGTTAANLCIKNKGGKYGLRNYCMKCVFCDVMCAISQKIHDHFRTRLPEEGGGGKNGTGAFCCSLGWLLEEVTVFF
jgi:hypothetical protein